MTQVNQLFWHERRAAGITPWALSSRTLEAMQTTPNSAVILADDRFDNLKRHLLVYHLAKFLKSLNSNFGTFCVWVQLIILVCIYIFRL